MRRPDAGKRPSLADSAPRTTEVLETPQEVSRNLMAQTHGHATVGVSPSQAAFLADTHFQAQRTANFAAPGFRPSEQVAPLRRAAQARRPLDSDVHNLHFEQTFAAVDTNTPFELRHALPAPHFGTGAFAVNREFAEAVGPTLHPPAAGFPDVPRGNLSYSEHQLRHHPQLSRMMDHLQGRTPTGRQGPPLMATGRFDTAVVETDRRGKRKLQQVDDKFNSASNAQDAFSQDQAERYATIVHQGGGSSEARVNDLMQLSQFEVTGASRLEHIDEIPAVATRGMPRAQRQARAFTSVAERDRGAYGAAKRHRSEE